MKTKQHPLMRRNILIVLLMTFFGAVSGFGAPAFFQQTEQDFAEYKGEIIDFHNRKPVTSAFLSVKGSNISTITNADGEFSLKIPIEATVDSVHIASLGYDSRTVALDFLEENAEIELLPSVEELSQVNIFTAEDPRSLVANMLEKRGDNYIGEEALMTVFYRESIQRRRQNVSLSEAVANIHKHPNSSHKKDNVELIKARKSTDYKKLDTLVLKLGGGPFNTLYLDVMKYPDFLFEEDYLDGYEFSFGEPTIADNRYLYVVDFKELERENPWYYGKLYIDAESHTLVKAVYNLNVDNRNVASRMFVKRKPMSARVYPVEVQYEADYRQSNGKWYYGYGNAQLEFVVNWKRKLFNSRYTVNSEMAVTDWQSSNLAEIKKDRSFMKPSVVMIDDVSGFADTAFWGDENIIEPEKSIQNAIEKIQRQLERENN